MLTLCAMFLTCCVAVAAAQEPMPSAVCAADSGSVAGFCRSHVVCARMAGVGATALLDTYLSQEHYNGLSLHVASHSRRIRTDRLWARQTEHEGRIVSADNRSGDGGTIAAFYNFRYALMRRWHAPLLNGRLSLMAGAAADARLGFVYNVRGSNNPAQAKASLQIGPSVAADYTLLRPRGSRAGVVMRYEAWVPLAGVMFSPRYGQSYYEIFNRGDYDRNIVPVTIAAVPGIRQWLTVDFRCLVTVWRVGWLGDISQSRVNGLKYHCYSHALMLGVVREL